MRLCTLAVLLVCLATPCRALTLTLEQETCSTDRMAVDHNVANAEAIIGGIFDMRLPGEDGYGCGLPSVETMLAYEAARWSIDRINSQNFVSGIDLGMTTYDTCYDRYRAVAAANHFYPQYSSMYCNETSKLKLGLLGAFSSWTSKPVADNTAKFPASMISPMAASPQLSDKTRFPYFMRTTPSASEQIKAMIEAMKILNWERIVIVHSDNDYGTDTMQEFVRLSQENNVCTVATIAVPGNPDRAVYNDKVSDISNYDVNGGIFIGSHNPAKMLMEVLTTINNNKPDTIQWMFSSIDLNADIIADRMHGAVVVMPVFTVVTEFFDYFTNNIDENNPPAANPWYQDWFMETFNCHIAGITYEPYGSKSECLPKTATQKYNAINTQFAHLHSTIMAVYAYAAALRQAQQQMCGNTPGMCNALRAMTAENFHNNYLSVVDLNMAETGITSLSGQRVKFDANGDFHTVGHYYWNFHNQPANGAFSYHNVGSYVDNVLTLDVNNLYMYGTNRSMLLTSLPSSLCPTNGCKNCVVTRSMVNIDYEAGDIVIAGLFDLHAEGTEVLSCGALNALHALNSGAFRYAINHVKTRFPQILNGVTLGSLVIDLCDNAETGRLFLNDLLGGRTITSDANGQVIDPNLVKGVVGELDSSGAMSMALMLGHHGMPYLESSATSTELSTRDFFPTFSRAVPSDYHQMLAIVLLLKRMNWDYVQVVHSNNKYGRDSYDVIKSEAASRGICIAATHVLNKDGDYAAIVTRLQQKTNAKIVVAVMDKEDYHYMMQEIAAQGIQGQFILIGTETWGRSMSVINGVESVAEGSITLDLEGQSIGSFENWLNGLSPVNDAPFAEWYQYAFNCYLDAKNRGVNTTECNPNIPITSAPRYEASSYTPFMISGTYAVALAIDKTLQDYCGASYNGICWQFRSSAGVQAKILEYVRESQFNINGYLFSMMEGEGKASLNIYSYSGGVYQQIGKYRTSDMELEMNTLPLSLPANFESECTGFCSECVYLVQDRPFDIIPGKDLKIGVNFAFNNPGTEPFICSDIRLTNGVQSYLAVYYALMLVNGGQATVALNNVDVGALLMDHCNSAARAYGLPSALYSGILESHSQVEPQPDLNTIRAWLTDNTLVTEEMKDFFSDLNLPVISPMATTNKFLDEDNYPTFVRTIQGDSTIASALAILAKSLGLQYVTVLYSANSFGMDGRDTFANIALQEGLCVVATVEMGSMNDDDIVEYLVNQPSHVVITYLTLGDMDKFLEARGRHGSGQSLVVISPEPYDLVYQRRGMAAENVLSLRMKTNTLDGYLEFLSNLHSNDELMEHPMLRAYYMELAQCNLPGEYKYSRSCGAVSSILNNANFHTDNYVLPIMNAVYTFVAAAHETLKVQCGEEYAGVCAKFYSDPDTNSILYTKLTQVGFQDRSGNTFQYTGKEGNTGREIVLFNGNTSIQVADFAGASINILDRTLRNKFENTNSACLAPCTDCINNAMNFTYIHGDILIGGIFDVHEKDLQAFSCGNINTLRGFQLLEAFHFAINKVNDKSGQFANVMKNVKLGGIGLDACQSAIRGGYIVSNIHSGLTELQRDDRIIDPDTIDAYIGTYSSDRSIHLARLLKSLKMPQISYGSTSVTLTDENRYPFFLRTVPADDRQAMAMIEFLRHYDVRYTQVVHSADNYGEQGAAVFTQLADQYKICIAQTVSFQDKSEITVENANDIVLALIQKPVANTVVVFADASHVNELLQAIERNPDAHGKFKFIGSDAWANNVESTKDVEEIALDSVTFDLDVVDLREFDEYLSSKTPANYPENPWFPQYYEEIHNCYLTIPNKRYPERCTASPENIVTSQEYKQDTGIIHVINAVYSAAYGLDAALKEQCGTDYTTICEAFKNNDNRREFVLDKIQQSSFVDMSGQPFSFYERGDGKKGYVLYSIDQSNVFGYIYNPIGKYTSDGALEMSKPGYSPVWDGSCDRPDSCTECPIFRNLMPRYMLEPARIQVDPATLVFTVAIHGQGNDEYRCGDMNMANMLTALAVLYTIQPNSTLLSDSYRFNLRGMVLDNCNNQLRIDQDLMNLFSEGDLCNENFDSMGSVIDHTTIMGVMTTSSRYVVAANRVTSPFKVQLMSSSASSTALSVQWRYPQFARTVPPDNVQMRVIAQILKANDWSYVGVIYSLESYGINGYRALQSVVNDEILSCIGIAQGVNPSSTVEDIRPLIRNFAEQQGVSVIVLIVIDPRDVLDAIRAEGLAHRFVVIGTDTWADSASIIEGVAEDFAGAITINFRDTFYLPFLNDYLSKITYNNRMNIPDDWFEEFYQHIHECYLIDAANIMTQYSTECNLDLTITKEKVMKYGVGIRSIMAAYAMADGLTSFSNVYGCANMPFARCLETVTDARDNLFSKTLEQTYEVKAANLEDPDDYDLELGADRYWNLGYNIYVVRNNGKYVKTGYQVGDMFQFNKTLYSEYRVADSKPPLSEVISRCPVDTYCDCVVDDTTQVVAQVQPKYMRDHEPRNYFTYDEQTGEQVYTWPIWAIAVAVLTCFGLLVGLLLFFYFLVFYPVKGGTTVLGFLMMLGIFGIYAINFAFFLPASAATCGAREFMMGVVYVIAIAPLFVKAVDNWRFKDTEYSPQRYVGLTNPCSLVLITLGIILIQCIIPTEWLILRNPSASLMTDNTQQHDWMWCDPHDFYDISMVLSFVFVMFLVLLTAIFSALSWDSDSNYFESRWIFVACICTSGCFLVWMVVSTNAGPPYRDPAIAIANFVNASCLLLLIPFRKLILLCRFQADEDKVKHMPADEDVTNEVYSTVYTNQMFQPDVFQPELKPESERGEF